MFEKSYEECLKNAESLLDDAETLMDTQSYGPAQGLSVIAFEEIGKAVILALADLKRIAPTIVLSAMKRHSPKKIILVGIEQSKLLLGQELAGEAHELILSEADLKKFEKEMNQEVTELEECRQKGFYVDVNVADGGVKNSPRNIDRESTLSIISRTHVLLKVGKVLCELFKNLTKGVRTSIKIREVRIPDYKSLGDTGLGARSDYTLTIVWDEM